MGFPRVQGFKLISQHSSLEVPKIHAGWHTKSRHSRLGSWVFSQILATAILSNLEAYIRQTHVEKLPDLTSCRVIDFCSLDPGLWTLGHEVRLRTVPLHSTGACDSHGSGESEGQYTQGREFSRFGIPTKCRHVQLCKFASSHMYNIRSRFMSWNAIFASRHGRSTKISLTGQVRSRKLIIVFICLVTAGDT